MTDCQRDMIAGLDKLLARFNRYAASTVFTVEDIIRISNEVVNEILEEENEN